MTFLYLGLVIQVSVGGAGHAPLLVLWKEFQEIGMNSLYVVGKIHYGVICLGHIHVQNF